MSMPAAERKRSMPDGNRIYRSNQRDDIEQALRKSEERFRQVVESAPSAMVMIGPAGQIEMINAQTERLFGYQRAELLGKPIETLVPERFRRNHPALRTAFFSD